MLWAAIVVWLLFVVFTVVQIGRTAWRFLRGDEDLVSGDSFGWQLFGGRKRKAP